MMQKEEKVVVVLLFMALGSLASASWALGDFEEDPDEISISLVAEGTVSSMKTTTGGHLIIRLQSSSIPIFVSRESGAEEMAVRVAKGDRIRAVGEISEYEGRREISVKRPADVEVLR
ncbi:MAG: OB-fold nucleic acid binding domain-containing protein [Methanothrix sp.]